MPAPPPANFDTDDSFKAWLKLQEGFRDTFQVDDVNGTTVVGGYGRDLGSQRRDRLGQPISRAQGAQWLNEDVAAKTKAVKRLVNPNVWERMTPRQRNAVVGLAFNVGETALGKSQTLINLNAGDFMGAAKAWLGFNHSGGKEIEHLSGRRVDEVRQLIGDDLNKIMPNEHYRKLNLWPFPG